MAAHGSWRASSALRLCLGALNLAGNLKRRSGGALQNLADRRAHYPTRQRLGLRRCSAAFDPRVELQFVRSMESLLRLTTVPWDHEPTRPRPRRKTTQSSTRTTTRTKPRFVMESGSPTDRENSVRGTSRWNPSSVR